MKGSYGFFWMEDPLRKRKKRPMSTGHLKKKNFTLLFPYCPRFKIVVQVALVVAVTIIQVQMSRNIVQFRSMFRND